MLKAASKKRSNIDIQRIQRIARESRSETLARLQASAEGLSTNKAEENRREYGKTKSLLIAIPLNGAYYGNQSLRHLRWFY